jgi:small subunit ribosomal protein S14
MSKKRVKEREYKRRKIYKKYRFLRIQYKKACKGRTTLNELVEIQNKYQKLPRNRSPVRSHNRCQISGRPRGYYRKFGLSRHFVRELAYIGTLPGIQKSSWLVKPYILFT